MPLICLASPRGYSLPPERTHRRITTRTKRPKGSTSEPLKETAVTPVPAPRLWSDFPRRSAKQELSLPASTRTQVGVWRFRVPFRKGVLAEECISILWLVLFDLSRSREILADRGSFSICRKKKCCLQTLVQKERSKSTIEQTWHQHRPKMEPIWPREVAKGYQTSTNIYIYIYIYIFMYIKGNAKQRRKRKAQT